MSMILNHNPVSLMGQRIMLKNSLAMRRSLEKLSTGLRTKIADVDNTAGLAISETMRSRIFGMEKALNNTQDGISLIQTATNALDNTQDMLMRMRELSVQAANDTLTQQDRSYIQVEINEIRDEITRTAKTTQFNRKRILSGDNAVLWSSTNDNVRAIINGGLRSIDQFGQKYAVDGNYKIYVQAEAGQAQVQKSDVFRIKHEDTIREKNINSDLGVKDINASGVPAGSYNFRLSDGTAGEAIITGSFGIGEASDGTVADVSDVFSVSAAEGLKENASVLFEVQSVDTVSKRVTLKATADILTQEGVSSTAVMDNIIISDGGDSVNLGQLFGDDSLSIGLNGVKYVSEGSKFVVSVSAQAPSDDAIGLNLEGIADSSDPNKWDGGPFGNNEVKYVLDGSRTGNSEIHFKNFFVNEKSGQVSEGNIIITTNGNFRSNNAGGNLDTSKDEFIAGLSASYVGKTATGSTKLSDIDKFWDTEGNFVLDQSREITLTQGDGMQAKVTIYAHDTVDDLVNKLNDAVAFQLGQAKYVDDASKFVTFADSATAGSEAVAGTMVIRSVLTGTQGEITLSGNEDVLKALSLNTVQESEETKYEVTVRDAHSSAVIVQDMKITGNRLVGVIHKNVDVEFDPMLGINAQWNDKTKNFVLNDTTHGAGMEVTLHLADNTTVFQTGASEGEDVMINIGDMSSHALGLDAVNVMNPKTAYNAIDIIDKAIDKVSMQQAKLGAAQNRLEHHLNHLSDETEALISANSRIRDTDYAQELMEYTKMQILMESNAAMLSQANQVQYNILNLFR